MKKVEVRLENWDVLKRMLKAELQVLTSKDIKWFAEDSAEALARIMHDQLRTSGYSPKPLSGFVALSENRLKRKAKYGLGYKGNPKSVLYASGQLDNAIETDIKYIDDGFVASCGFSNTSRQPEKGRKKASTLTNQELAEVHAGTGIKRKIGSAKISKRAKNRDKAQEAEGGYERIVRDPARLPPSFEEERAKSLANYVERARNRAANEKGSQND